MTCFAHFVGSSWGNMFNPCAALPPAHTPFQKKLLEAHLQEGVVPLLEGAQLALGLVALVLRPLAGALLVVELLLAALQGLLGGACFRSLPPCALRGRALLPAPCPRSKVLRCLQVLPKVSPVVAHQVHLGWRK